MLKLQDALTGELVGLARAVDGNIPTDGTHRAMIEGLLATDANTAIDNDAIKMLIETVKSEKAKLIPRCADCASPCSRNDSYNMEKLLSDKEDIRSLKLTILFELRGMAAYVCQTVSLDKTNKEIFNLIYKSMFAVGENLPADELLDLATELSNFKLTANIE